MLPWIKWIIFVSLANVQFSASQNEFGNPNQPFQPPPPPPGVIRIRDPGPPRPPTPPQRFDIGLPPPQNQNVPLGPRSLPPVDARQPFIDPNLGVEIPPPTLLPGPEVPKILPKNPISVANEPVKHVPLTKFDPRQPPIRPDEEARVRGTLIAYINGLGLMGYVMFVPNIHHTYNIIYHIAGGLGAFNKYDWRVYAMPAKTQPNKCSVKDIGPVFIDLTPLHGQLEIGRKMQITSKINVTDSTNLLGRALTIVGFRLRVCSTILPIHDKRVFEAKFHGPVVGKVMMFQSIHATGILVEYLMYSNERRQSHPHKWTLVTSNFNVDETGQCPVVDVRTEFTHFNRITPMQLMIDNEQPLLMTRKYQTINEMRMLGPKENIVMIIYDVDDANKVLACASFQPVRVKRAQAAFNSKDVHGLVEFQQNNMYEPAMITIDLTVSAKDVSPYSYGIDILPKIKRQPSEVRRCPNIMESIYNPYNIDPEEVPAPGLGTSDMYAMGDLSGKYGSLESKTVKFRTMDNNLLLSGKNNIIGRAFVLYNRSGNAFSCSNIELVNAKMAIAYATFDRPLQGQIIFSQVEGDCFGDTFVYAELSKPSGTNAMKTVNHKWHIHENKLILADDKFYSTDQCKEAGPHYNPFNVTVGQYYEHDCNDKTTLRCEYGDLAKKLDVVDIKVFQLTKFHEPDVQKYFEIDTDLCLSGPFSIINRSIVIHDPNFGSSRLSCSNILEYKIQPQTSGSAT